MGGYNSGRRASTPDTDQCLRLSLTDLRRDGALKRHQWSRRERYWKCTVEQRVVGAMAIVVDLDCRQPTLTITVTGGAFGLHVDQVIEVVAQPQPLGGERFYAICPLTGRRCTVLIIPPGRTFFASVRGWGVPYRSTREREVGRAIRAMVAIERRKLSKYARKRTRTRIGQRWLAAFETVQRQEKQLIKL